ncbi:dynamin-binding protein-like [Plakobranchus ocellatus]|uniref:Dynamin-binding protein-like n=1 Tax=Plakobranchus ocellatus TaxID=259542 RepID=A0AAV4BL12_9GAST|nr:dynamin-binding protein-like [Plakobranchus ocellatus]
MLHPLIRNRTLQYHTRGGHTERIAKYKEARQDLQARLAEAADDAAQTVETRDNLQFVENTLAGLQEEERGLKENLFSLDPHEGRLEKARLLAAQHAAEEEKRKEEERQAELARKRKRKEQRANVLDEIVDTEKDYLFSMQLCMETFMEGPKPPPGIDLEFLLGNMEEIADVSQKVLLQLEANVLGKSTDDQCVGRCFTAHAEDMKNTYAPYCRNHDDVITVLEKYADPSTPQAITDYISGRLEKMREQMNVFDLAGVLIKPVQRILKYPLLLNELLKNTEDDHPDKFGIVEAIKSMTDVAKAINEYKRRKDLVYKYKKSSDQTFSDKISKLNLHSIKKKSSRMKGRLSTNLGIGLQTRDEAFEREEVKFRSLEKAVKIFHRSVVQYLNDSQDQMRCRELFIDDIVEFYSDRPCIEVQKLQEVTTMLVNLYVNMELQSARNDYEAMNAQLMDELPKFHNLACGMLRNCVSAYVLARRDFMDQSLKESCCLLELPSIASKSNVMEVFNIRHTTSYDHVSLLSFIPRGFNPRVDTIKADKARLKGKGSGEATQTNSNSAAVPQSAPTGSQSDSQKAYLRSTYPANKLFKVTKGHVAADLMDISLTEGMLVGVVKELDPMGNKERWFLDDGLSKGFAPSTGLTPATESPANSVHNAAVDDDILSVHSYDSGDNVVISGNDGRAVFTTGTVETSPHKHEEQEQKQYHYALYDFTARQPNEASLQAGHPVNVLAFQDVDGNTEWWLIEGADGQRGYAPANYMAPMPYS